MKKTLRIICAVLLAAFTLGACSITGEPDFKGHTKEDLESSSLQMIEQLQYMSADDLKTALESFNSQKDSDPDNASTYDMYRDDGKLDGHYSFRWRVQKLRGFYG